jgi:hypothetical protein
MPWVRFNMDTMKGEAVPEEELPVYFHLNEETEESMPCDGKKGGGKKPPKK